MTDASRKQLTRLENDSVITNAIIFIVIYLSIELKRNYAASLAFQMTLADGCPAAAIIHSFIILKITYTAVYKVILHMYTVYCALRCVFCFVANTTALPTGGN